MPLSSLSPAMTTAAAIGAAAANSGNNSPTSSITPSAPINGGDGTSPHGGCSIAVAVAVAIFAAASFVTLLARNWLRLSGYGPWSWDDATIVAAFCVAIGQAAAVATALRHGYGLEIEGLSPAQLDVVQKALYSAQLLYIVSCGLSRASSALLVARLAKFLPPRRYAFWLLGFVAVWTLASVLAIAIRGDLSRPWTDTSNYPSLLRRWIAVESIAMAIELALFILSLFLTLSLRMSYALRSSILCAFGCRLLIIALISLRLYYLDPSRVPDPTSSTVPAAILTQAVLHYGEIAASLVCLKPFVKAFRSGSAFESVASTGPRSISTTVKIDKAEQRNVRSSMAKQGVREPAGTELSRLSSAVGIQRPQPSHRSSRSANRKCQIVDSTPALQTLRDEDDFRNHAGAFTARVDSTDHGGDDAGIATPAPSPTLEVSDATFVIQQTRTWSVQTEGPH